MNKLIVSKWQEKAGDSYAANGLIRKNTNKPEYGSLMLITTSFVMSGGFMNKKNKVGFVTGEVDALEDMIKTTGLKEGSDYSAVVGPHRIVTLEKTLSEVGSELGYREKINPSTEEVLTRDGEPILWKTEVVAEGSDIVDTLITHDTEDATANAEAEAARAEFSGADKGSK